MHSDASGPAPLRPSVGHHCTHVISKRKKIIIGSLGFILLIFIAVLFVFGGRERTVVGDYRLEQWEDFQTYYLHKRGHDDSAEGGSFIGGITLQIGWNKRYIVAERHSFYRGDPDGWMVIDVKTGNMAGPFTESEFRARPDSQGIQIYGAAEAWKKL